MNRLEAIKARLGGGTLTRLEWVGSPRVSYSVTMDVGDIRLLLALVAFMIEHSDPGWCPVCCRRHPGPWGHEDGCAMGTLLLEVAE
jgi:hypothetical protein